MRVSNTVLALLLMTGCIQPTTAVLIQTASDEEPFKEILGRVPATEVFRLFNSICLENFPKRQGMLSAFRKEGFRFTDAYFSQEDGGDPVPFEVARRSESAVFVWEKKASMLSGDHGEYFWTHSGTIPTCRISGYISDREVADHNSLIASLDLPLDVKTDSSEPYVYFIDKGRRFQVRWDWPGVDKFLDGRRERSPLELSIEWQ